MLQGGTAHTKSTVNDTPSFFNEPSDRCQCPTPLIPTLSHASSSVSSGSGSRSTLIFLHLGSLAVNYSIQSSHVLISTSQSDEVKAASATGLSFACPFSMQNRQRPFSSTWKRPLLASPARADIPEPLFAIFRNSRVARLLSARFAFGPMPIRARATAIVPSTQA